MSKRQQIDQIAALAFKLAKQDIYACLEQLYTELHAIRLLARKLKARKQLSEENKRKLLLRALVAEARFRPGARN